MIIGTIWLFLKIGCLNYLKGSPPCSCMVYTWALKCVPYPYVGVFVYTIMILGPLRLANRETWNPCDAFMVPNCKDIGSLSRPRYIPNGYIDPLV